MSEGANVRLPLGPGKVGSVKFRKIKTLSFTIELIIDFKVQTQEYQIVDEMPSRTCIYNNAN